MGNISVLNVQLHLAQVNFALLAAKRNMNENTMKSSNPIVSCQNKKAYLNKQEADDTATYLWYEKGVDVISYRCQICENYHLTSGEK